MDEVSVVGGGMCKRVLVSCILVEWIIDKTISFFFFFQAEDGIRDLIVTGVQTCALPIWSDLEVVPNGRIARAPLRDRSLLPHADQAVGSGKQQLGSFQAARRFITALPRSEERRVGKECRSRWSPYH